jgi:hypothetical protein
MDEKQFLDLYFNRENKYQSDRYISYYDTGKDLFGVSLKMDNIKMFKSLTSLIDYKCNFDKYGHCKKHNNSKCCCAGCKESIGFLKVIWYKDLPIYAEKFDDNNGFWTPKGCSLPRELRSPTCLCHSCKLRIPIQESNLFSIIQGGKKELDKYFDMYLMGSGDGYYEGIYEHLKKRLLKENSKKVKVK